jgi:5-hydroxyisourate hydrolase/2-oxo-4-hydroxy-4-carboxy-5-ureidoimidazoline decarboxylase
VNEFRVDHLQLNGCTIVIAMKLADLNKGNAKEALFNCCGSAKWTEMMVKAWPYNTVEALVRNATDIWYDQCGWQDWLEAFTHHPKIGDVKSLSEKFVATANLAGEEQSGVRAATQEVIEKLAKANEVYEKKFGFIFIVFATGKSATEMLRLLEERLDNSNEDELHIAMGEQHKITITRLKKMLDEERWQWMRQSQLTTHVLDTSIGKPGKNISIRLQKKAAETWSTIAQGITNEDGRISDLLAPGRTLPAFDYKLIFDTGNYFRAQQTMGFYPLVEIQFSISDDQHYHVPLLINPFGYSTYRGS